MKFNDLSGQRFGSLLVIEPSNNRHHYSRHKLFICRCDCDNIVEVLSNHLIGKNNTSCGKCNRVTYTQYDTFYVGKDKKGNKFFIDLDDFESVSGHYWMMDQKGYWGSNIEGAYISLHRFIMNATPEHPQIDHRNGYKGDCRKLNLRFCTPSQNNHNKGKMQGNYTSKYKGVCWDKSRNRWLSNIRLNGRLIGLGTHIKEIDAARAYNKKAIELFGENARINDLEELE